MLGASASKADTITFDLSGTSSLTISTIILGNPLVVATPTAVSGSALLNTTNNASGVAPGQVTLSGLNVSFGTVMGINTNTMQLGQAIGTLNAALTQIAFAPGQVVLQIGAGAAASNTMSAFFGVGNLNVMGSATITNNQTITIPSTLAPSGQVTVVTSIVGTEIARIAGQAPAPVAAPAPVVPEPASAGLLLMGLAGLAGLRLRKR